MKNLKELIILHSNDMHGDFLAEQIDEKLVGGVSLLSGYVNMVRNQEKNVLYAIAGDMFRGSVIDSEYKGVSTIGIMNLLGPDVATIGNHEVDYGLAHLLFLEKCANFPIINANFHIRSNHKRLFRPHYIAEIDGMKILFIGIITEDVLAQTKAEELVYPVKEGIVSSETSGQIREILEKVVSLGSGKNAGIQGYHIGGKTATSQTLPRSSCRYISSFLGFAPAENPQVLGLCIIHDPKGVYYGGTVAAPVIRSIFENILPYLGIEKTGENSSEG